MARTWMKRISQSLVVGVGGAIYTWVDEPFKKLVDGISPTLGSYIPQDPLEPSQAFVIGAMSSFLALSAYDILLPPQMKKLVDM